MQIKITYVIAVNMIRYKIIKQPMNLQITIMF